MKKQLSLLLVPVVALSLISAGTVMADDPELAAHGVYRKKDLLRVIIDPKLRLSLSKKSGGLWGCDGFWISRKEITQTNPIRRHA